MRLQRSFIADSDGAAARELQEIIAPCVWYAPATLQPGMVAFHAANPRAAKASPGAFQKPATHQKNGAFSALWLLPLGRTEAKSPAKSQFALDPRRNTREVLSTAAKVLPVHKSNIARALSAAGSATLRCHVLRKIRKLLVH